MTTTSPNESVGASPSLPKRAPAPKTDVGLGRGTSGKTEAVAVTLPSHADRVSLSKKATAASISMLGSNVPKKTPQEEVVARIGQMVERANSRQTDLKISVDSNSHDVIVQIVSQQSGEVVRQIPPEELVDLHRKLADMRGVLFHKAS